ncbi:hypothetical protein [Simplicispira hankyongi]|uniref:Glycosyltransferase n=1 Tax=Simplicispira hankyongi TaxID=2315688 RepID=A0A398CDT9_9BURK|nr:hypothetical protein [Simplicispira hankyongi]RID97013.1 hypothetical protein D3F03_15970 [Simplicispira hankyongi]
MNQPTPAIVPHSAVRPLPRWALLLLCTAYVLPGFIGRDPWRGADVTAYGYMLQLAQGHTPWLAPLLGGLPPESDGLLPYWIGAWALQGTEGILPAIFAARIPFALLLVLTLWATWWGIYALARSPGAQPVAFAFGGEASPAGYARAIADGGLLALLASLGLAQPSHETTAYLTQLCATALVFYGLAAMPRHRWGPWVAMSLGLPGLVLSGAPVLAVLYGTGGAVLCLWAPEQLQHSARNGRAAWGLLALTLAAALLAWQLGLSERHVFWPDFEKDGHNLARLLLWFTWPAWPLALWTLWRWRGHVFTRSLQRHLWLPMWFAGCALGATVLSRPADRALLLGLPALAALAAFALPTLKRSVSALIDWFTLLFFSASAIAIWVIWISTQTGIPAQPAANVARLAHGFRPEFSAVALAVALAATAAWCAVVVWRTGRNQSALWKTLVLPAAGTTLCWLLLTTLWLPMLDYARSDAPQVRALQALIGRPVCVHVLGLDQGQFAALQIFGSITMQPLTAAAPSCPWLVEADDAPTPALRRTPPDAKEWVLTGRIGRPTDRNDALVVYRRAPP